MKGQLVFVFLIRGTGSGLVCILQALQDEDYTPTPTLILNKCKLLTDVFDSVNLVKA